MEIENLDEQEWIDGYLEESTEGYELYDEDSPEPWAYSWLFQPDNVKKALAKTGGDSFEAAKIVAKSDYAELEGQMKDDGLNAFDEALRSGPTYDDRIVSVGKGRVVFVFDDEEETADIDDVIRCGLAILTGRAEAEYGDIGNAIVQMCIL